MIDYTYLITIFFSQIKLDLSEAQSIYLWIATTGLSISGIQELRTSSINHYVDLPEVMIYKDALIKIEEHFE